MVHICLMKCICHPPGSCEELTTFAAILDTINCCACVQDMIKFGHSTREYVLLHAQSNA